MKKVITGIAFTAMLALSLIATTGEAFAASVDTRDGGAVVDGRGGRPAPRPAPIAGTTPATGTLQSLGVTWE